MFAYFKVAFCTVILSSLSLTSVCIKFSELQQPVVHSSKMLQIGFKDKPWLPLSFEVEFWSYNETLTKTIARHYFNYSNVFAIPPLPADMMIALEESCHILRDILVSLPSVPVVGNEQTDVRSVIAKKGHDAETPQNVWIYEREGPMGKLELSSPIDLSEEQVEFGLGLLADNRFRKAFKISNTGLHFHVDSRCLLKDEQRVVALLLIWERFHDAIATLTRSNRSGGVDAAAKLAVKNPELLRYLQMRWMNPSKFQEPLKEGFRRLSNQTKTTVSAGKENRDGYRNFAVNVCHLLDVDCCRNCAKNTVPKFGGLEFRLFDASFDRERNRHCFAIPQRLVQATCVTPLDSMMHLVLLPNAPSPTDARDLLAFLDLDSADFESVFAQ